MSEKGFTTDEITLQWLDHFIESTSQGPSSPMIILLMDNHGSHTKLSFLQKCVDNNILPYPLLPHLTHCMQPLDVGIFCPYKHWHDVAIRSSISQLNVEYGIREFLQSLPSVRDKTFKKSTIKSAWKKSGMWPISTKACLKELQRFKPPTTTPDQENSSFRPTDLQSLEDRLIGPQGFISKRAKSGSRASKREAEELVSATQEIFARTHLLQAELNIHQKKYQDDLDRRASKRRRLTKNGPYTRSHLKNMKASKERDEADKGKKRQKRNT